jgi:hypothetical protein
MMVAHVLARAVEEVATVLKVGISALAMPGGTSVSVPKAGKFGEWGIALARL